MAEILPVLVLLPAAFALAALAARGLRTGLAILLAGGLLHAAGTASLWRGAPEASFGTLFRLDGVGLVFLSITSALFLLVSLSTVPYILHGTHDPQSAPHRFAPCLLAFLSAMTLVAVTHNLALMWAAVEGTTLASAPLVYFYRRRGALEAAWKYLLLCSVGIALALLGTFCLGVAASSGPDAGAGLTLEALRHAAPTMARPWLKAAFVLALVGYGTKMGLVPLHTWLPDTHSQAPSPVSALLSGALLNCAFLAILRFFQVCVASGDAAFARTLLVTTGFASVGVACAFMVGQRDYKRLFAYSSIENMGIVALGVGVGGTAAYGAVLHSINHSLCKAGLFLLAGNVLHVFGTTSAREVRGAIARIPATGVLLATLFLAIGGLPPFGPFWSEFLIFQTALRGPHPWTGVLFLVFLTIAFLGMAGTLLPMLQGAPGPRPERAPEPLLTLIAPFVLAAAVLAIGLHPPRILSDALLRAAALIGG
ncbi:MAG TPA: proton-conducting transporter membrane subunit [Thermoanaerobaculia bacterium]|nr:proton-conducting transporter membrane subunit [Thermoanaerobaculia bacterium]